jgi:formylmethanofuran dehydrogenase subunit E
MRDLGEILHESSKRHRHLCPRQVLGARMALVAAEHLDLELPRLDKRLLITAETDGCMIDGISAATGCDAGGRTLRILDIGKVAATFTDVQLGISIRVHPAKQSRVHTVQYAPDARSRWHAMLHGYQVIPAADLFIVQPVRLVTPLSQILGRPGTRVICQICQEEIINGREATNSGTILCRTCAGEVYYQSSALLELSQKRRPDALSA